MGTLKVNNIQSVTDGSVTFPQGSISNQPVTFPSGTASNPSLSFTGDTDTGIYRIDANKIGISTGGSKVGEIGVGYGGFIGNIIQVVQTNITSVFTTGLLSLQDVTNFNCSITPKYNNSLILILANMHCAVTAVSSSSGRYYEINLLRASTQISTIKNTGIADNAGGTGGWTFFANFNYIDNPSTISTINYKCQARVLSSTEYRLTLGLDNSNSNITLMEIQQ